MDGVLIPEATYFRQAIMQGSPQKMYIVQLDGVVREGDCGAAVIDRDTGGFCGHIVRGCPETRLAYIIAASDIVADVELRFGKPVVLANLDSINRARAASDAEQFRQLNDTVQKPGTANEPRQSPAGTSNWPFSTQDLSDSF